MMRKNFISLLFLFTLWGLSGCGGSTNMESFLREEVDLTYVVKVAVVPFENISKDQYAAERLRGMVITQILAQGLFDVVDKGLVDSALREEAIDLDKGPMDAGSLKRLGQRLNVQAFLLGTIDQSGAVQRGSTSYPELSITLRLVDTNTGMIFWQASGSRSGDSMGKRLFGLGSDDEFKIALKLLRQILASISSERKVKLPVAAVVPEKPSPPEAEQQAEPPDDKGTEQQGTPADQAEETLEEMPPADQVAPMGEDESLSGPDSPALSAPARVEDSPPAPVEEPTPAPVEKPTPAPVEKPPVAKEVSAGQTPALEKAAPQSPQTPPPAKKPAPQATPPAPHDAVDTTTPPAGSEGTPPGQKPPASPPVAVPQPLGDDEWPE